jgi:hypothetical protein
MAGDSLTRREFVSRGTQMDVTLGQSQLGGSCDAMSVAPAVSRACSLRSALGRLAKNSAMFAHNANFWPSHHLASYGFVRCSTFEGTWPRNT